MRLQALLTRPARTAATVGVGVAAANVAVVLAIGGGEVGWGALTAFFRILLKQNPSEFATAFFKTQVVLYDLPPVHPALVRLLLALSPAAIQRVDELFRAPSVTAGRGAPYDFHLAPPRVGARQLVLVLLAPFGGDCQVRAHVPICLFPVVYEAHLTPRQVRVNAVSFLCHLRTLADCFAVPLPSISVPDRPGWLYFPPLPAASLLYVPLASP